MKLKELICILQKNNESSLKVMLPSGEIVPEHFHVTEVGKVIKKFIDCGGTVRNHSYCSLQVWTANDVDHRLASGKLLKILKMSQELLGLDDETLEVEYGSDVVSNYFVFDIKQSNEGLILILDAKKTDCLAPDKCGITQCKTSGCC